MLPNYHLYLEFWSKDENGDHVLLVIEREFPSFGELMLIRDKLEVILGGKGFK
jgi:hypothetical protein